MDRPETARLRQVYCSIWKVDAEGRGARVGRWDGGTVGRWDDGETGREFTKAGLNRR